MRKEINIMDADWYTYDKDKIHLDGNVTIRHGTILLALNGDIYIGDETIITQHCHIDGPTKIGKFCILGPGVKIITHDHDYDNTETAICRSPGPVKPVTIGDNCYIGAGAIILQGVTIHKGCVIGAGSVVTNDIPPESVAYGNPCRVRRKRGEDHAKKSS